MGFTHIIGTHKHNKKQVEAIERLIEKRDSEVVEKRDSESIVCSIGSVTNV